MPSSAWQVIETSGLQLSTVIKTDFLILHFERNWHEKTQLSILNSVGDNTPALIPITVPAI